MDERIIELESKLDILWKNHNKEVLKINEEIKKIRDKCRCENRKRIKEPNFVGNAEVCQNCGVIVSLDGLPCGYTSSPGIIGLKR